MCKVNFITVAILIHLKKTLLYPKTKQIRILSQNQSGIILQKHISKLSICFIRCDNTLYFHGSCHLYKLKSHLGCNINSNCKHFLSHIVISLSHKLLSFLLMSFTVATTLLLCILFHLETSTIKNQDWYYAEIKQELEFFLTV